MLEECSRPQRTAAAEAEIPFYFRSTESAMPKWIENNTPPRRQSEKDYACKRKKSIFEGPSKKAVTPMGAKPN